MSPQSPSPALFFDTISAYQRTEALRAAIELDLFTLVAAGQRTATQLASACQASPRGIRILADYLTILGFLRKLDDHYELTQGAASGMQRMLEKGRGHGHLANEPCPLFAFQRVQARFDWSKPCGPGGCSLRSESWTRMRVKHVSRAPFC